MPDMTDEALATRLGKRLMLEEGFKLHLYPDTKGLQTIGIGHLCTAAEVVAFQGGITKERALELFQQDVKDSFDDLDAQLPWWRKELPARQMVLLDMCFNMGIARLLKFKNSLAYWKAGKYEMTATNLALSAWDKQVGKRADRLQEIVRTGVDDGYGA